MNNFARKEVAVASPVSQSLCQTDETKDINNTDNETK
jgi:hypothetical protein